MPDIVPDEMAMRNGRPSADPAKVTSLDTLPNEIISQIFEYLDVLPPSFGIAALHDEPDFDITKSDNSTLKQISLTSKQLRDVSKPILFKHAQFIVRKDANRSVTLSEQMKPFFNFVAANALRAIRSFTLLVHDDKLRDSLQGERQIDEFAGFWSSLFQDIDPIELLIVAPPEALGALTSCRVYLGDAWSFDCPCHYLRLQRAPGKSIEHHVEGSQNRTLEVPGDFQAGVSEGTTTDHQGLFSYHVGLQQSLPSRRATSATLFALRHWDQLLLNEGSFIRAYASYEFWLRKAPSILQDLIGIVSPGDQPHISPTVRDMSYVAMFPMCNHFADFTENLPRLDRLFCQLVPRNQILSDPKKMVQIESEDLWMERNASYAALMRELFHSPPRNNYQYLKVFESGDAADRAAWSMAVEYVKRANNGWKVGGEGIFIRKTPSEKSTEGETEEMPTTLSVLELSQI